MFQGYIALHRQIQDNKLWIGEKFTRGQAWVDMLLLANHKEGTLRIRGISIIVERGQIGWSFKKLGVRWMWSKGKVNRFLNELETEHQIELQKTNVTTLITIVNYDAYQATRNAEQNANDTANGTQTGSQTERKQTPNNNDNNDNNDNKKKKRFQKPSPQDVHQYISKNSYSVDADQFISFYESNGWKVGKNPMKSWQAAVRTWHKRNKPTQKPRALSAVDQVAQANQISNEKIIGAG